MSAVNHFIDTQDLGPEVIREQFALIKLLKAADKDRALPPCSQTSPSA